MVRPSAVRPSGGGGGPSPGSYRREPEGIEASSSSSSNFPTLSGTYDHSAEYDPYQSAARQMQELLFGSGGGGGGGSAEQPQKKVSQPSVTSVSAR